MKKALAAGGAFLFLTGLLVWPGEVLTEVRAAVETCAYVLIPSLFPCMALASFLAAICRGAWFTVPLSLLGGFPVAARVHGQLHARGVLTASDAAARISALTCSGPAFVLTAVGVGLRGSRQIGLILLAAQWGASLLTALGVRLWAKRGTRRTAPREKEAVPPPPAPVDALVDAVRSAASAMATVCAFVLAFAALAAMLEAAGVFAFAARLLPCVDARLVEAALRGLLEVTSGCVAAAEVPGIPSLLLTAFALGFGGLCVAAQVRALARIPLRCYMPLRFVCGVLSAGLTALGLLLFPPVAAVYAPGKVLPVSGSWVGSALLVALSAVLLLRKPGRSRAGGK